MEVPIIEKPVHWFGPPLWKSSENKNLGDPEVSQKIDIPTESLKQ